MPQAVYFCCCPMCCRWTSAARRKPCARGAVQPALSQPGATDRLLHRHDAERPAALPERRKTAPSWCCRASAIRSAISGEEAEQARRWLATLRPICSSSASPWCASAPRAAGGAGRAARRLSVHHPPRRYRAYPPPAAQVKENRIFVEDRGVYTSAGITTGIDLALHGPSPLRRRPGARRRPRYGGLISAAPGTIRSCRPGCATATTCTRRCTARRT